MQSSLRVLLSVVLLSSMATFCRATCDECGCANECSGGKICKLICEEKTISVVCYKCEDEHFCIPDPSCKGCKNCESACEKECSSCSCNGGCTSAASKKGKRFVWFSWKPNTAQLYSKKKLYTKTVKKKIPSYKWVVVDRCECGACAANFKGRDTGYVKEAPLGLEAGQSIAVGDQELQRLAKNRTKPAATQSK